MYLSYFGLRDFPFRITPDIDYLYMSPSHSRAKSYMEYAFFNHEGFVVITGEIGSGKTTLIKQLNTELDDDICVANIFQTQLNEVEFLQAMLVEFGLNPFSAKKVELLNMMNKFLIECHASTKKVLLIVDDSQFLSKKVLEEICMLSAVETQKEKILHVLLVGQPELNHKLEAPDMQQVLQRVSLRYHIKALTKHQTSEYVTHRIHIAGCDNQLFEDNVYDKLYEYTGGIPRLINTLCDTALTCAYADGIGSVNKEELESAIEELQWKEYKESFGGSGMGGEENLYEDAFFDQNQEKRTNSSSNRRAASRRNGDDSEQKNSLLNEIAVQLKRIADSFETADKSGDKRVERKPTKLSRQNKH